MSPPLIARQEKLPDTVIIGVGQSGYLAGEVFVRLLQQHAGAIPGLGIRSAGAPMSQILQQPETVFHQGVADTPAKVDNSAYPARCVRDAGVVEALSGHSLHSGDELNGRRHSHGAEAPSMAL